VTGFLLFEGDRNRRHSVTDPKHHLSVIFKKYIPYQNWHTSEQKRTCYGCDTVTLSATLPLARRVDNAESFPFKSRRQ
jgi:hypothetical protein